MIPAPLTHITSETFRAYSPIIHLCAMSEHAESEADTDGRTGADDDDRRANSERMFTQSMHDTLERSGELRKLKAAMRSTILNVIRGGDTSSINKVRSIYRTTAVDLVHALIVDYLQWSGYHYALDMFVTESGTAAAASATGSAHGIAGRRMELSRRVAGGTADGGDRLAEGVKDVPVLLAMVVQGMRLEDAVDDEVSK